MYTELALPPGGGKVIDTSILFVTQPPEHSSLSVMMYPRITVNIIFKESVCGLSMCLALSAYDRNGNS